MTSMAITHADLENGRGCGLTGAKAGSMVIVLCVFAGLLAFIFCLLSEFTRSEAAWMLVPSEEDKKEFKCTYNRNGRFALLCGIGAAVILASAMLLLHAYMWLAFKNESPLSLLLGDHSMNIAASRQATALFLTTWVCFGVAQVLLVMGIVVESLHLEGWQQPRRRCLVMRPWLFLAAGIFELSCVLSATLNHVLIMEAIQARGNEVTDAGEAIEAHTFSSATQLSNSHHSPNSSLARADEEGIRGRSGSKITTSSH